MRRLLALGILLGAGTAVLSADDGNFSQQLAPADFSAAGLSKLSPAELAKLDQLVREHGSAAEARASQAEADATAARAAQAAEKKKEEGFLAKTRALLLPGAQIEFQPLESRIVGTVYGWDVGTVFTLENGQRWQVENNANSYSGDEVVNPKVTISPAPMSGFKMEIDGFPDVRVRLVGNLISVTQ